jgi:light-regulated signal transduction histidine kinase (bacteriophytochrome)
LHTGFLVNKFRKWRTSYDSVVQYQRLFSISVINHARKAAELAALRRAGELAISNVRLEEFAHDWAHDLRERLITVSLYAQLLLRKTKLEPNAQNMTEAIVIGAAGMRNLDESVRLANLHYKEGITNYLEVPDANRSLFSEQLTLAQSPVNKFQKLVQLYRASGGGWQQ